ncbi:Bug family tripartite tricarboxylate transporter substrate binding protein [Histidinibacterium aquaticum]|nr:tripartite tricarboxylate transporter substrate binding protein [Histidinibacterium aquaticum]
MTVTTLFKSATATAAITLSVAAAPALAEYPERPVTMIVAWGAGGSTDTMARIFSDYIGEDLGQRFVVENREGAGGEVGWTALANAEADGYTIGLINSPSFESKGIVRDDVGYSMEDIRPLVNVVTDPGVIAVSADSPYETLDDFVEAAKENPGELSVSHEGVGGDDHLAALDFTDKAGIDVNFVTFDGNAEATAALQGGHIDAFEGNMSEVANQIENGSVRALAVWSSERMDAIPDVPTGQEQGYDVISAASRGLAVPAELSDEQYNTLLEAARGVIENEEFRAELAELNMPVVPIYGEDFVQFLENNRDTLQNLWEKDPWIEQ